jgi:hypothetical protein
MICVPTSLAQEVGAALGAQAGEAKLREVITPGGFSSVRRVTETPFNMAWKRGPRAAPLRSTQPSKRLDRWRQRCPFCDNFRL